MQKPKIIVVLGPTATGKSDLAVELALKYNGEVISADSRQVYRGLDLGTGKISKKEMRGVVHHMLDICSPKSRYDVSRWQKNTKKIIADILERKKIPIICGGTGFYIRSIVEGVILPEVKPDKNLRAELENKSLESLVKMLGKLDKVRLENIDTKNKVRLIRAIEIAKVLGKVPEIQKDKVDYQILQVGLKVKDEVLKKKIHDRILSRMKKGMIKEAQRLHDNGLSWKRMFELGLEYRFLSLLLQNKISKTDFVKELEKAIWQYVRRQKQWFGYDKNIKWYSPSEVKKIEKEIKKFLK